MNNTFATQPTITASEKIVTFSFECQGAWSVLLTLEEAESLANELGYKGELKSIFPALRRVLK
ncbi:hypothetical protein [uncultured Tateyamaria sp.]|uniref:hypothetical protein n=1 Tax=uncultured Tateyamaria sp. TaxID=455651 RepID=UPI00260251E6|nr:hypothetical protein [uncultured Tateyamaria sp.]